MKLILSSIFIFISFNFINSEPSEYHDSICIVCSEVSDESNSVKYKYTGINYEFCSEKCLAEFRSEPVLYLEKVICLPCDMDDADEGIYMVHEDTKYYFCNTNCLDRFKNHPEKFITTE